MTAFALVSKRCDSTSIRIRTKFRRFSDLLQRVLACGLPRPRAASVVHNMKPSAWLLCAWLFLLKLGPTAMFLVIVPELFATEVRGAGVGACVMMQHLLQIAISYMYPILLGAYSLSHICAGCAASSFARICSFS